MKRAPIIHLDPRLHVELFKMMFDHHSDGVIVTDADGVILYYNRSQGRIDDLTPEGVGGRSICDVYNIAPEESPTMVALQTRRQVIDKVQFYFTRLGKLVNSCCSIYPLADGDKLLGALSFVSDYSMTGAKLNALYKKARKKNEMADDPTPDRDVRHSFDTMVGQSPRFKEAVETARAAAVSSSSVMLIGETGTGKELFAQSIHALSPRRGCPYTVINCAAIPENLLEGLLFGTVSGSFTGAQDKPGLFEITYGGTLFLDEINSMPIGLQSKLLRAIQERRVRRVGALEEIPVNIRIISAVSRDPAIDVAAGNMRADLLYRLGVIKVFIPPLRERADDLAPLVQHFLRKHNQYLGRTVAVVSPEVEGRFKTYEWPGNVRELEHTIEAALHFVTQGYCLNLSHLAKVNPDWNTDRKAVESGMTGAAASGRAGDGYLFVARNQTEINSIKRALSSTMGQAARAARLLGISPQLLNHKLKKFSISLDDFKPSSLI